MKATIEQELERLLNTYVTSLCDNITDKLGSCPSVIEAFGIFDPSSIPDTSDEGFKDYGNEEINTLAEHFFPGKNENKQLESQWLQTKHFIKKQREDLLWSKCQLCF
jgi:hypothetical protein